VSAFQPLGGFVAEVRTQHHANLVTLFRTGMTQAAICRETGVGKDALLTILRAAGAVKQRVAS
jgi:hypothetical protein